MINHNKPFIKSGILVDSPRRVAFCFLQTYTYAVYNRMIPVALSIVLSICNWKVEEPSLGQEGKAKGWENGCLNMRYAPELQK